MRFGLLLLILAIVGTHIATPIPAQRAALEPIPSWLNYGRDELLYVREVRVSPLAVLKPESILALIDRQESNFTMNFSAAATQAAVQRHPMVQNVSVERCAWWSWRCFQLTVTERTPTYALIDGDRAVLVGNDGVAIASVALGSLRAETLQFENQEFARPRLLTGLLGSSSPDSVRAGFEWSRSRVELVEEQVARKVVRVSVRAGDSIQFRLEGLPGDFTISEPRLEGDISVLQQAKRLKAVISQLGPRAELVRSLDLGFRKLAVLKF